jgi:hypothetical protein
MLVSIAVACGVFALLSLPGIILVAGTTDKIWVYVAAGFCSQAAVVLATALVSFAVPGQIPVAVTLAVAALLSVCAFACRPRAEGRALPTFDPWAFVVPACATLTAALITRAAITIDDGDLMVRAFYNADGFKHLAHVQAIAAFGLPARDLFGGDEPLAYYWFFHVIPALGAVLQGDAAEALIAGGLVQVFAFWIVVYGLVCAAGARGPWAALLTAIGWLSPSLDGLTALTLSGFDLRAAATDFNIEALNTGLLNASSLFRASLYIPQHLFMLAGLLSWATIALVARPAGRALRVLALAPVVSAGAISAMLGAACLAVYAATRLWTREDSPMRCLGEIAAVGILAAVLAAALGLFGFSFEGPALADKPLPFGAGTRFLLAFPGLLAVFWVALLGLAGLQAAWRMRPLPGTQDRMFRFAVVLTAVGLLGLVSTAVLDQQRLALEFALRVSFLGWLGLVIGAAWLVAGAENGAHVRVSLAGAALLLALGLVTPVLDAAWHAVSGPRWIVRVPKDDLAVLRAIRNATSKNAVILQQPAMPFVSGGADVWVPPIAARKVFVSPRATHWSDNKERYEQALAFFEGRAPLPEGEYGYIYLSRALAPETYDQLMRRLADLPGWQRKACFTNACLWERAS